MELFEQLNAVIAYFNDLEKTIIEDKGSHTFKTEGHGQTGVYQPNPTETYIEIILNGILGQRNSHSLATLEGLNILSAGSGDGRAMAVATALGMQAYGIELDDYLKKISDRAANELVIKKLIDREYLSASGDFVSESSYQNLGIPFNSLDYIVHSINSMSVFQLMDKFATEGKEGASLILLGGFGLSDFKDEAEQRNLNFSRIYKVKEKLGTQGTYVFMTKK